MSKLEGEILAKFVDLLCRMSPENLSCDGMASKAYMKQKVSQINKEWKELEIEFGRKVTEDEAWEAEFTKDKI